MKAILDVKIPLLRLNDRDILKNISFSLPKETILSVVGPNGAGKTTLLKALFSPRDFRNLKFTLHDNDISKLSGKSFANKISYLGASDFSQPLITIEEFFINSCYSTEVDNEEIHRGLKAWELESLKGQRVSNFSLGEFQRLLLATTFYQKAELYILDEPERHLDPAGIKILQNVMSNLRERGKNVIFTSHDINLSISTADIILGINKDGEQDFLCDRELLESSKYLNKLFNVNFQYLKIPDGTVKVFI